MAEPVFIIGGSRTGSEMLKKMLSATDSLDFVDELFLRCPRWLHTDLQANIDRHVGDLDAEGALQRLLDLLYSGIPFGWFWSAIDRELDREMLRKELLDQPLSIHSIFCGIMKVHAEMRGKRRVGAKFPLHYSYVDDLLRWFPDCKLIHTTRNPKAVYASQASKYAKNDYNRLARGWIRFQQFVHINIQTSWTARVHQRLQDHPNYCLVRYEDVVGNPEEELRRICSFANLEFDAEMLYPKKRGSSHQSIGEGRGVDEGSLERWRTAISPLTANLIGLLHKADAKRFGYTS